MVDLTTKQAKPVERCLELLHIENSACSILSEELKRVEWRSPLEYQLGRQEIFHPKRSMKGTVEEAHFQRDRAQRADLVGG